MLFFKCSLFIAIQLLMTIVYTDAATQQKYLVLGTDSNCDTFKAKVNAIVAIHRLGNIELESLDSPELMSIGKRCISSFEGDDELAQEIQALDEVESVEISPIGIAEEIPQSWNIDRINERVYRSTGYEITNDTNTENYDPVGNGGLGINIYVIDSGCRDSHDGFQGRATNAVDFTGEGVTDGNGHGTHCAGTAGARYVGVAPNANIICIKVLRDSGAGDGNDIINGLTWALTNQQDNHNNDPMVISFSIVFGVLSNAIEAAFNAVTDEGHIVVLAAGNNQCNSCTEQSPQNLGGDAVNTGLINVAASDRSTDNDKDTIAYFSCVGGCIDIIAPGRRIESLTNENDYGYANKMGTSMACPAVAGAAAVYLAKHNSDRSLALDELINGATTDVIDFSTSTDLQIDSSVSLTTNKLLYVGENGQSNTAAPTVPTESPTVPTESPTTESPTVPTESPTTGTPTTQSPTTGTPTTGTPTTASPTVPTTSPTNEPTGSPTESPDVQLRNIAIGAGSISSGIFVVIFIVAMSGVCSSKKIYRKRDNRNYRSLP